MDEKEKKSWSIDTPNLIGFGVGVLYSFGLSLRHGLIIPSEMDEPLRALELIVVLGFLWVVSLIVMSMFQPKDNTSKAKSLIYGLVSGMLLGSCGMSTYHGYLLVQKFGVVWN